MYIYFSVQYFFLKYIYFNSFRFISNCSLCQSMFLSLIAASIITLKTQESIEMRLVTN